MIHSIKKQFKKHNCLYKRIGSGLGWYIYKVCIPSEDDAQKQSIHYEYFKQRFNTPTKSFGHIVAGDSYETYPSDEAFGVWAWCCTSLDYALRDIKRRLLLKSKNHCQPVVF